MSDQFREKKEKLKSMLQTLHDSCREGESGFWDGSKEGFASMAENVEDIATLLNLKIKETYTGVETNEWFNCKCTANTRWDIHDS